MNAQRFTRAATKIAGELEARFLVLNDEDRETLSQLLGGAGRVLSFMNGVKSPDLKAAGGLVMQLFQLSISLRAPVIGVGDKAGDVIEAALPEMQAAAPTVAAVLRAVVGPA